MFLSNLSIKHPVFATMMMAALAVLGIASYRQLKVDMFPKVEIPVVTVTTIYPGAGPETVEREVTKKIEEEINTVEGVKHIESISQEGLSNIVVEFQLEVSAINASQDVRGKIAAIRGELPREIEEPIVQRIDFGLMPILSVGVDAPGLSPQAATTFADKVVKKRLENVRGVGCGRPRRRVDARDPGRGRPPEARGVPRLPRRGRDRPPARERRRAGRHRRPRRDRGPRARRRARPHRRRHRRDPGQAAGRHGRLRARRRAGGRRHRGAAERGLPRRAAGPRPRDPEAVGRQHRRGGRRRPRRSREAEEGPAARDHPLGHQGRLALHPRVDRGREHDDDHRRPPDRLHRLPVPELLALDGHHRPHPADLGRRRLHRDAGLRLHPERA